MIGVFALGNVGIANLGWIILLIPWLWIRTSDMFTLIYALATAIISFVTLLPEARRYMEHYRQCKLEELAKSYYDSSSMARGIKKIMDWRNNLGKWKYPLAILVALLSIAVFYLVYSVR